MEFFLNFWEFSDETLAPVSLCYHTRLFTVSATFQHSLCTYRGRWHSRYMLQLHRQPRRKHTVGTGQGHFSIGWNLIATPPLMSLKVHPCIQMWPECIERSKRIHRYLVEMSSGQGEGSIGAMCLSSKDMKNIVLINHQIWHRDNRDRDGDSDRWTDTHSAARQAAEHL